MNRYSSTLSQSVITKAFGLMAVAGAAAGVFAFQAGAAEQQSSAPASDVAATYGDVGVTDFDVSLP